MSNHDRDSDPNQNSGKGQERKISGKIHVDGEVEVNLAKGLIQKYDTNQNEEKGRQERKYRLDKITLIIAVIYASLTAVQSFYSVRTFNATSRQNAFERRPFVVMGPASLLAGPDTGGIFVNVGFSDYGRGPAIKVVGRGAVFYGPTALQQADAFFKDLGNKALNAKSGQSQSTLAPGPPNPDKPAMFTTLITNKGVGTEQAQDLLHSNFGIVVVNRIEYQDIDGHTYRTDFCAGRLASGLWPQCENHNEFN